MKEIIISVQKQHNEIIKILEDYYPESFFKNNITNKNEKLPFLSSIQQLNKLQEHSPTVISILNHSNMRYEYFSENIKSLLGYEAGRYKQPDGFEFAMTTFYPNHSLVFTNQIVPKILEFYNEYSSEEIKDLRFTFTFLCKTITQEYIWCMQQISVLETDERGLPLFTIVFLSNVNEIKKDHQLDFIVSKRNSDGSQSPIFATTFLDHSNMTFLTKRELEILNFIKKGFLSKEIADALAISEHTVNNHRKNILKKADGMNIMEIIQKMSDKCVI